MKLGFLILFLAGPCWLMGEGSESAAESPLYSPVGKRDPLKAPSSSKAGRSPSAVNPIEKYSIEQLELKAVLRASNQAKALFQDPEGNAFIVGEGERIGREGGTVSRIERFTVVVTEQTQNYIGERSLYERVISLPETD